MALLPSRFLFVLFPPSYFAFMLLLFVGANEITKMTIKDADTLPLYDHGKDGTTFTATCRPLPHTVDQGELRRNESLPPP